MVIDRDTRKILRCELAPKTFFKTTNTEKAVAYTERFPNIVAHHVVLPPSEAGRLAYRWRCINTAISAGRTFCMSLAHLRPCLIATLFTNTRASNFTDLRLPTTPPT